MSRPPPFPSYRVSGNCLSGVGCGVPHDGLTHGRGEVADAEGLPRVVSVDAKHVAPRGANLCSDLGRRRYPTVPNGMR